MDNEILLSICVPTYNRENQLKNSLKAIVDSTRSCKDFVEIIVSDNFSVDNTQNIVMELKSTNENIHYYCNNSNLGANRNFFLLTDIYAKGKYCWIIGDDDYIDNDSVQNIIDVLRSNPTIDYLALNFRIVTKDEFDSRKTSLLPRKLSYIRGSYASVIDNVSCQQNLFATFISSSVFIREPFANFSKSDFLDNTWDNLKGVFPNGYILATLFHDSEAIYIREPVLSIIPGAKSWDHRLPQINANILPSMYEYLINIGCNKRELKRSVKLMELSVIIDILHCLKNKTRISRFHLLFFFKNTFSVLSNNLIIKFIGKMVIGKILKS